MVQTPVVPELNATVNPLVPVAEVALAVNVGVVPKFWAPGFAKVIVWLPLGVAEFDAADATLLPTEFVAFTVNVYAVPLVKPLTVAVHAAGPVQLPVAPPGFAVAV